jgi:3-hydroxyisobutyrate dehydrogenase
MKIGFIGLGNMGAPMALNLLKAGNELVVFDVIQKNIDSVVEQSNKKAIAAKSVKELAQSKLDLILTMLPAAQHVRSVYLGADGLLENVSPSTLLVDSSTIDPQTARDVCAQAKAKGNDMLDAPVSGGTGGAQAGTLTFMVGGDEVVFNANKSFFQQMGKNIFYCGGTGNGQVAKVSNNMLLGISMIATAEAMALGVELGMDPKILASIINTSSGRCWSSDTYNPYPGVLENAPASRGYSGGFGTDLMLKDLGLAVEAAKSIKQPVMLGGLAAQIYQTFSKIGSGNGHLDFSAVIQMFKK